jgi:hypothetical protein
MDVLSSQLEMLSGKNDALSELYSMCNSDSQLVLISDLLKRFNYVDATCYGELLVKMANYIRQIGYPEQEISVTALAIDESSDSSQAILQDLKVPLAIAFNRQVRDSNKFEKKSLERNYCAGCRHFIAVDEFVGSGSTIVERYSRFQEMKFSKATIDFCVMSGMEEAQMKLQAQGINVKIFNLMQKGISDHFHGEELHGYIDSMTELESKLADRIGRTKLSDHSFGYRHSESLYYKFNGNIPNNVFPLFWWKEYFGNKYRNTLFTRVQKGY